MRPEEIRGNIPIKKKRMGRPPSEGESFYKNVNVRLRKDQYEFIEVYTKRNSMNKGQFIRFFLDNWILNYKKNNYGGDQN